MFIRFFENFSDFGLILGGLGLPKNTKKSKKTLQTSLLERIWSALSVSWSLWEGLGSVLGMFCLGFGRFCKGFGKVLGGFGDRSCPAQMSKNKAVSSI